MGRRKGTADLSTQRDQLIQAGEKLVQTQGISALTARALAAEIGYSVGHIYHLVDDLDALILHINARTLERLYERLHTTLAPLPAGPARLKALAKVYLAFCKEDPALWSLALSHQLRSADKPIPPDYEARIAALPALVAQEIKALFPKRSTAAIKRDVALLWAGLHGICSLALTGRLEVIAAPQAASLADTLITTYITATHTEEQS